MMHSLENYFFEVFARETVLNQATSSIWMTNHRIYFVEGQPVFYFVFVACADSCDIFCEHVNYFS